MADEILPLHIGKLELSPGDILVVKTDRAPPATTDVLRALVPAGVRVLYIPSNVDLSVMTRAEIDKLTA